MAAWTDEEVELLHNCMLRGYGPSQISSEFTAKGFSRSVGAIRAKKAKEISIVRKDADAEFKEKRAAVIKEALKPDKEPNYVLMFALLVSAMIIGWWFVS